MIGTDRARAEPAPPLRILLVEDDEFDVAVFGRAFHRGGIACEIVRCRSGEETLDGLRDAELELDVLVTDHQLPGVSGFDLCLRLIEKYRRPDEGGARPPFALVLLTGVGSEQMAIRALRAGINDYIVKDASREYLDLLPLVLPRVARRHRQRRRRRLSARERRSRQEFPSGMAWPGAEDRELMACAEAVKLRGGRIWLEDASGSAPELHFSVSLTPDEASSWAVAEAAPERGPAPPPSAAATGDQPAGALAGAVDDSRHVLIAHPNPIVAFVARQAAERSGCLVAEVGDGLKALEALGREPFDLMLTAVDMPELDGLETARRIRRRENRSGDRLAILALAAGDERDQPWREAGIDGVVAAPVSVESLRLEIAQALDSPGHA